MIQYPLTFKVSSHTMPSIATPWETSVPHAAPLTAAIPTEFGGLGGGFSPEDFYALAVLNCFCATFKVIAEKSKLMFVKLETSGELTVDRNESGAPWMSQFALHAKLYGAEENDKAKRILEKTSQSCIVLNSIKTAKTFQFEVL